MPNYLIRSIEDQEVEALGANHEELLNHSGVTSNYISVLNGSINSFRKIGNFPKRIFALRINALACYFGFRIPKSILFHKICQRAKIIPKNQFIFDFLNANLI